MTGPLATIAALHALLAGYPKLAESPISWEIRPNGELHAHPQYHADGSHQAVRAVAAALGCDTSEYRVTNQKTGETSHVVRLSFDATLAGAEVWSTGYERVVPLPVRAVHTDAEQQLCADWIDQHGDPADWSHETRLAYANVLADMRADGAL